MQQLSGLDAAFLAMETPSTYGHVGSVCILDAAGSPTPITLDNLTALIESRLHLIPPFRRRLLDAPFGIDHPYWIEDANFDIEYHVRELALPAPGGDDQLAEQAARLHARHLDRRRPLWELYLIHGLSDGRVAIYTKVHHSAIDGVSGNDVLTAVLDLSPEGRPAEEVLPVISEDTPSTVKMTARTVVTLVSNPIRASRLVYSLLNARTNQSRPRLPVIDDLLGRDSSVVLKGPGLRAPATPFNKAIGPHRRWAFRTLPFEDVRAIKNASGATVNDVVMALCTGALRRWLELYDALPDVPLVAAVPVSIRREDEKGTGGNRISAMFASLPTNLADPAERLRASSEAMAAAKQQHGAQPAGLLSDVTQVALPALAGQAARLSARLRLLERVNPFNLIISNVPGPNIPLYYAGARLLNYYPLSAITDGQGLNMTVISLDGGMHFGLIADRELVPDIDVMAGFLVEELKALVHAVVPEPTSEIEEDEHA